MRAAAGAVSSAKPVLSHADLVAQADAGVVTTLSDMNHRQLVAQAARLVSLLPVCALAFACQCTQAALAGLGYDRVANHVVERQPRKWRWSTLKDWHNTWARWLVWLDRHDVMHDGSAYNAVDLGDFWDEIDTRAKAKGLVNKARAEAKDAAAASAAAAKGLDPPPPTRYQDGHAALDGVKAHMRSIRKHFGIQLPIEQAGFGRVPGARVRMPTPALTPEMVFRLCAYVVSPVGRCAYHAAVAAALLFCVFSCNRCEQANSCVFRFVRGGFLHGILLQDKHPDPDKKRPRPFWMRVAGPVGGDAWFAFLCSVLAGVEAGCFVFRDFDSDSGDPRDAKRFLNNPLVGARLLHAIRCVLMRVCGMSWAEASHYALHCARHVLMEVAGARGEAPLRAVEIGRWSGSTAQDDDLTPSARIARRHQLSAAIMPESYAPLAKVERVCAILGDQMRALDALYVASRAAGGLPLFGGFGPLAAWPAEAGAE